jgi:hypothetical protein
MATFPPGQAEKKSPQGIPTPWIFDHFSPLIQYTNNAGWIQQGFNGDSQLKWFNGAIEGTKNTQ